ncbi:MAG: EF-hand domain-containing protein, partial [Gemmataceae bacterium]|nr:EF-hand domain-containing protein [Gemmataceae bacterium]
PAAAEPPPAAKTGVPDWFTKMDRNGDGDISRREFLGPLSLFRRLDADGDGLITPDEARE